jgi:hypothetical protein
VSPKRSEAAIETWQAIGHGSQVGLYAFLPMLALLPLYSLSGKALREGKFGASRALWRAIRRLEHACPVRRRADRGQVELDPEQAA